MALTCLLPAKVIWIGLPVNHDIKAPVGPCLTQTKPTWMTKATVSNCRFQTCQAPKGQPCCRIRCLSKIHQTETSPEYFHLTTKLISNRLTPYA